MIAELDYPDYPPRESGGGIEIKSLLSLPITATRGAKIGLIGGLSGIPLYPRLPTGLSLLSAARLRGSSFFCEDGLELLSYESGA